MPPPTTQRRFKRRTSMSVKTCSACNIEKPLEQFKRHGNAPDGRMRYCLKCYYARMAKASSNKKVDEKICLECGESLTKKLFGKHSLAADGLQSMCKPCQRTRKKIERRALAMKKTSRRGVKLGKSEGAPIVHITIEKLIIEIV